MIGLLLIILLLVILSGISLYSRLSFTAVRLSGSIKSEIKLSGLMRQISLLTTEAENHVRSYRLTHDKTYLITFYRLMPSIESEISLLKAKIQYNPQKSTLADSLVVLTQQRFELLRNQLDLEGEERVPEELKDVSNSIDQAFLATPDSLTNRVPNADAKPKESFLKRLFGRRSKNSESGSSPASPISEKKATADTLIKARLKETVNKTKQKQLEKITILKNRDLLLSLQSKRLIDQINHQIKKAESFEREEAMLMVEKTKAEVTKTKYLAAAVSSLVCLFLCLLVVSIVRYVRTRKQYELALSQAKQQAEDLAKTKEFFLANMSHEIKTPLNAIHGFTEQLLQSPLNSSQEQQLSIVKKSADYLSRLVTNILSYSRLEAGKMVIEEDNLEVKKEMKELEVLFEREVRQKNIQFSVLIDPLVPEFIYADPVCLKQVLFNVVGNALKFTEQGQVNLLLENAASNQLRILVTDTGIGIPAEKLSHLFNEYAQVGGAGKKFGGTGLGLVITKKLLAELGGRIQLTSSEGKGTEVEVIFPYKEALNKNKAINEAKIFEQTGQLLNKSILIVDDEVFNRLLLQSILNKQGVKIQEATNGAEALSLILRQDFDLVIMDIRMPVKDGIEACREIRKFDKHLPILASTAVMSEEKMRRCLEAGFTGFVHKPFTEQQLISSLTTAIGGAMPPEETVITPATESDESHFSLKDLARLSGGDKKFEKELLVLFQRSINSGLEEMELFEKTKNWEKMADLAHKMIPPCKHFEANKLLAVLLYFETLRKSPPDQKELKNNLAALKAEVTAVNLQLQLYL